MKTKLLLLAVPAALALGTLASAQSLGARPASAGEHAAAAPTRVLPPPAPLPYHREIPPMVNQGVALNYCTSTANSTGLPAWLTYIGDLSCNSNNTCLQVFGVPPTTLGFFFFGTQPAQIPLGNGYLCVSPFSPGLYRLPAVTTTPYMSATVHVDLSALPKGVAISPGSTRYFQFWFRDPAGGGAQSNFSDALKVCFCQ